MMMDQKLIVLILSFALVSLFTPDLILCKSTTENKKTLDHSAGLLNRHAVDKNKKLEATVTLGADLTEASQVLEQKTTGTSARMLFSSEDRIGEKTRPLTPREKLRKTLLTGYSKMLHPVKNMSTPVPVQIGLGLIHVDLDEAASIFKVHAWMRFEWKDEFLTWDPADYDGVDLMYFGHDDLWSPDIFLYNNADEDLRNPYHASQTHFLVYPDGHVRWVPPAFFKAFCKMDLQSWPMDKQTCILKFGSWTSSGQQIALNLYKNSSQIENMTFYTDNREWHIDRMQGEKFSRKYECCPELYHDVIFTFNLQRRSPTYRSVIILPCLVLMLFTSCAFLLTPDSGEKIIISGIAFVGGLMYLIYFATSLPFHAQKVPVIVTLYSNTVGLVGIAMLLNVICMTMARERKYSSPPKFLTNLFSGCMGKLLCLGNYSLQVSATHQRLVVELGDMAESEQEVDSGRNSVSPDQNVPAHSMANPFNYKSRDKDSLVMKDWLLVAAGIERLFFLIYATAYAVITSVYA